jgi:hypothetical protein
MPPLPHPVILHDQHTHEDPTFAIRASCETVLDGSIMLLQQNPPAGQNPRFAPLRDAVPGRLQHPPPRGQIQPPPHQTLLRMMDRSFDQFLPPPAMVTLCQGHPQTADSLKQATTANGCNVPAFDHRRSQHEPGATAVSDQPARKNIHAPSGYEYTPRQHRTTVENDRVTAPCQPPQLHATVKHLRTD